MQRSFFFLLGSNISVGGSVNWSQWITQRRTLYLETRLNEILQEEKSKKKS